jgi:hypothetical protein
MGLSGVSMKFLDFYNDGWPDIIQANGAMVENVALYHSAAEPQPKVEGAQGRDCGSTEWLRPADISGDAAIDQRSGRDDGLPVGQTGATDGIWQASVALP